MITVENLTKSYRTESRSGVVALDDVSLQVAAGSICAVVGEAGSGKSTLARCIGLLERPDRGAIKVDGTNLSALDGAALRGARRHLGVVPQGDSLQRERTAAGNIALPLEVAGMPGPQRRARVAELLDLVGLTEAAQAHPEQLNAGQHRRVSIARALAAKPAVLLADDPTADLESGAADAVLTVLERARSEFGATVVATTGDTGVIRRIADEAAVLDRGRIVESGKVLDLVTEPGSRIGGALLPDVGQPVTGRHDVVAEVVLVGFAAVGALLPEASGRFGVDLAILGGGMTRLGDTPVAKFRIGLTGERAESALKWMVDRDAHVRRAPVSVEGVAAA